MTVPYWVQDAVFYQIFPDRFANGEPGNDPPNVLPWGSPPTPWGFQGGDLRGIIAHFDYLLDLGINAIYLNPIFQATSNHRYNATNYYLIDPKLGDLRDFHALLDVAHRSGVRVILDGVFNHCGRSFFAFADVLENREHSPYRDWFHINHFPVDAFSPGEAKDYQAWWGFKSLPKLNTTNASVRRYILDVARYWIEQGADGWRLDVPNEIDDDSFWAEFRRVVKAANPDAYLLGEIWTLEPRWVSDGHFDGLMNYPVRECLLNLLQTGAPDSSQCAQKMETILNSYRRENAYAMYVPLGSHDTERILTKLDGDLNKTRLAFLFQFAYPGAPAIYYGDEIGLKGGKDPECRAAFPWNTAAWNEDLHSFVKTLVALRKRHAALRRGSFRSILADNRRRCYAFARTLGEETIVALLNASPTRRHLRLPTAGLGWEDGRILRNLLGKEEYIVSGEDVAISLPPWSGAWVTS
jgi:glycosidase